jgi:4-hydroxybenzoate polyprenyltransferase
LLFAIVFSYLTAISYFIGFWLKSEHWPDLGKAVLFFVLACLSEVALEIYKRQR